MTEKTISHEAANGYFEFHKAVKELQNDIEAILKQNGYIAEFPYLPDIVKRKDEKNYLLIPLSVAQPLTTV